MNKASEEDCRQHSHLTVPLLCQVRPLLLFAPLSFFNKTLFSWPPKSLQTVTEAMKFEDICFLQVKL